MKHLVIFTACLVALTIVSCKKKKSDNPYGNQRLSEVDYFHGGGILRHSIFYDKYNNIDSIAIAGGGTDTGHYGFKKFRYFGSSFSVTNELGASTTVLASTSGMILKVLLPDTLIMIYNGTELGELDLKSPTPTPPYYSIVSMNYEWSGGDINTAYSSAGENDTMKYDLSRNGQPGDPFRINDFLSYGRPYIKTTHLPVSVRSSSGTSTTFSYQFDGGGRISSLTRKVFSGAAIIDSSVYTYAYY